MFTLKSLFTINSISCISSGVAFTIYPTLISSFLSVDSQAPSVAIRIIGIGLILNGLHLVWAAQRSAMSKAWALYFSVGDILWVVFTFILIFMGAWITTPKGIAISLIVAAFIGGIAILQLQGRKAERGGS